ncbi:MAG: GRP family sugar transporter [Acidobacteriota bacterium]
MATGSATLPKTGVLSLHRLGVMCGLAAGAWLGAAEAPTKLVTLGFSPFLISMGMVVGVFVARWTLPMALKGTTYVWRDLREKPHLIPWAILAGALWAVANTLTIFAIRDIGLSVAFPLWNTNSLVGLFWGVLLFKELRGAGAGPWAKVLGGAIAIVAGACVLGLATSQQPAGLSDRAGAGLAAALGAGLLWGTMYIPYRKAYISGMNPLSFVTIFTLGELVTIGILTISFVGGVSVFSGELSALRSSLFWLFLGGFCWVIGDLFQQYAAKYVGIARGIPLSNTNQLWGLAWGALVFGELHGKGAPYQLMVILGSLIIVGGAVAISRAEAPHSEQASWRAAMMRECGRYGIDPARVEAALTGDDPLSRETPKRAWWDFLIIVLALAVFVWLGLGTVTPDLSMNPFWMVVLVTATVAVLTVCTAALWKRTRFS